MITKRTGSIFKMNFKWNVLITINHTIIYDIKISKPKYLTPTLIFLDTFANIDINGSQNCQMMRISKN